MGKLYLLIFERFIGEQRLQVIFDTSFGYTRERYRWRIETKFDGQDHVASAGKRCVWYIKFLDVRYRTWLLSNALLNLHRVKQNDYLPSKNVNGRIYG